MVFNVKRKSRGIDPKTGKKKKDRTYTGYFQYPWMKKIKIVPLGVTEKQVALTRLREIARAEEILQYGNIPRSMIEGATTPLISLLDEFSQNLITLQRSHSYISHVIQRIKIILSVCHWQYPKDIDILDFEKWRNQSTYTGKTKNHYHAAVSEFCKWLFQRNFIINNPMEHVAKVDLRRTIRRKRKAYTLEQIQALLDAMPDLRFRCIIMIAFYTGLRRNEIANLKWEHIHFIKDSEAFFSVPASITKNAQYANLQIHPALLTMLKKLQKTSDSEFIVGKFPAFGRIKKYWEKAGIPVDKDSGYDFHSLRVTFGTLLARNGNAQRIVQAAMRHSDSKLTENIYNDITSLDIASAIETLPDVGVSNGVVTEIFQIQNMSNSDRNNNTGFDVKNNDSELKKGRKEIGGERGIRTPGTVLPVRRFSKPFLSATQASLHMVVCLMIDKVNDYNTFFSDFKSKSWEVMQKSRLFSPIRTGISFCPNKNGAV